MGYQVALATTAEPSRSTKKFCSIAGNLSGTPHVNIEKVLSAGLSVIC
jgi:hypothetical protein